MVNVCHSCIKSTASHFLCKKKRKENGDTSKLRGRLDKVYITKFIIEIFEWLLLTTKGIVKRYKIEIIRSQVPNLVIIRVWKRFID